VHADLLIFIGLIVLFLVVFFRYKRFASKDKGLLLLLIGAGFLMSASLVDYLEETAFGPVMLAMTDRKTWEILYSVFGYVPGIFLCAWGALRWANVAIQLDEEIQKRLEAETALIDLSLQLKEALIVAEGASRAKTEFLANISHELRTPLNAILGFSEAMMLQMFGQLGNTQYTEYSTLIHKSGQMLLDIINDILDLAKVEAGRMELDEANLLPEDMLEACLPIVQNHADRNKVRIVQDVAKNMPVLRADKRFVKQMLLNLLSNAIKFTSADGVITVRSYLNQDGCHVFEVEDTGIGMTKDELNVAIEPFGQVGHSMTRSEGGTGLGLAIVKTFMSLHDGTLELVSEKNKGTIARLIFPAPRTLNQVAA